MKDTVILEFATRLEREARAPECEDGSDHAAIGNAKAAGRREGLREAADGLRMLVGLLGEPEPPK